jgi:hypothetical protein
MLRAFVCVQRTPILSHVSVNNPRMSSAELLKDAVALATNRGEAAWSKHAGAIHRESATSERMFAIITKPWNGLST